MIDGGDQQAAVEPVAVEPAAEQEAEPAAAQNGNGQAPAQNVERRCAFCNDVLPAGAHADQRFCNRICKEAERARKDQRRALPWSSAEAG
jgi:hypothetical protein